MEINGAYYDPRGVDASEIFEQWMHAVNYEAALKTRWGWRLDSVRNRRLHFDNIFCLPSEVAEDLLKQLNG
jgi:hypothetical protein